MAFLDNSGDIILDAVLTDAGRARLAKGDGTFRIVKFALGDDEIDYSLYNKNDSRGSAYYDIDILSAPILEAFTDNMAGVKSKLISISRNNLLYLPVIKLNELETSTRMHSSGAFFVAVDTDTEGKFGQNDRTGVLFGTTLSENASNANTNHIRLEQGLDTTEISPANLIDSDLIETQYIVEIDNRLGKIVSTRGQPAAVSYIDDDNIASYYLTLNTDNGYIEELGAPDASEIVGTNRTIRGPQGTFLKFKIGSSLDLSTSTFLFERLGDTVSITTSPGTSPETHTYYYIDTTVRVVGATTGYRIDIPVRFLRLS